MKWLMEPLLNESERTEPETVRFICGATWLVL
jgi:hypothetical protein